MKVIQYLFLSVPLLVSKIFASELVMKDGNSLDLNESYDNVSRLSPLRLNQNNDQLEAFYDLMTVIETISKEGLNRNDEGRFATTWLSAVHTLVEEAVENNEVDCDQAKIDSKRPITFHKSKEAFGTSSQFVEEDFFSKSKMVKDNLDESEDEKAGNSIKDGYDEENEKFDTNDSVQKSEEKESSTSSSTSSDDSESSSSSSTSSDESFDYNGNLIIKRRRGKGKGLGSVFNADNLAAATNLLLSDQAQDNTNPTTFAENKPSFELTATIGNSNADVSLDVTTTGAGINNNDNAISEEMMTKLQEELVSKILLQIGSQLGVKGEESKEAADLASQLLVQAVVGGDLTNMPAMDKESAVAFLRNSSLPFVINKAVKKGTGVDILKGLSASLRGLNGSLGVLERILRMSIKTTQVVRHYILLSSKLVAEMAREDNMKPLVDLSVPVSKESVALHKKQKKKKSLFRGLRGLKKKNHIGLKSDEGDEECEPMDKCNMGIQLALAKARDYSAEFEKIPQTLLLRLIHTVFAELEKRSGVIRKALVDRKYSKLISLHDAIYDSVDIIYDAIIKNDQNSEVHLNSLPRSVLTDILIQLIYPVKMEPADFDAHIIQVTKSVKPFSMLMSQDVQLQMLGYILNEEEGKDSEETEAEVEMKKSIYSALVKSLKNSN